MERRIETIDYLKCICILLMILFHIVYISEKYPYGHEVVYTFHMPVFLLISGYLCNVEKPMGKFFGNLLWLFIPYVVMLVPYICLSSVLPVRGGAENLSLKYMVYKVFINPNGMGPYWYLHTLILCYLGYYVLNLVLKKVNNVTLFIALGLLYWLISLGGLMAMANAVYFLSGVILKRSRVNFNDFFQGSVLALVPLVVLCYYPINLNRYTLAGIVITYSAITFFLSPYKYVPDKLKRGMLFIGQNTLPILLFSPIFTMVAKSYLSFFSFDPTGICFAVVTVVSAVVGSLFIAWVMDKTGISRYFCGKHNLLILSEFTPPPPYVIKPRWTPWNMIIASFEII